MSTFTHQFACHISKSLADSLQMESARIYNAVMVEHWRIYRKKDKWLNRNLAEKLNDNYDYKTPKLLHSHSIDASQQAFYKACKTITAQRKSGMDAKYPKRRKRYRTTIWKSTGVYRVEDGVMLLNLAKGLDRIPVKLPSHLDWVGKSHILEVRLVFNRSTFRYSWHMVVNDGVKPEPSGKYVAGVDLGEIHPAVISDGEQACVFSCRELRSLNQYRNKRLASIDSKLATYQKGSRRWRRLKARKRKFLAQMEQKKRDIEHKISHSVVEWAVERDISLIAIGDVRNIAKGKRLNKKSQQKISNWSHGTIRKYIKYKAQAKGIEVDDKVSERYTTQTCPSCGNRHKPKNRNYKCPACGSEFHRDVVGASNIASQKLHSELGKVPAPKPKYRHPFNVMGKRSPHGTREMARFGENCSQQEAVGL